MTTLPPLPLPHGVTERYIDCHDSCGLNFHILEAGRGGPGRPLVVFVHGFPELAYSWRKLLHRFAEQGYWCVALDQRGYGRTTGWDHRVFSDVDMTTYRYTQLVRDLLSLVHRLGRTHVDCVVGHDFGAVTAAMAALMRSDFFKGCVIMSHPFDGVPTLPLGEGTPTKESQADPDIETSLAMLGRKHYKWSNSTSGAAKQWDEPVQGLTDFYRGYIYLKSACDARNQPAPLQAWTASELAKMPHYYIQKLDRSMAETVAEDTQGQDVDAVRAFLPDGELEVYVGEWQRTGFQGALNWYRSSTSASVNRELQLFSGKKIECPTIFVSGKQDWGNCQKPGALEAFPHACSDFRGVRLIEGAGHWPQQEQPDAVFSAIMDFLHTLPLL